MALRKRSVQAMQPRFLTSGLRLLIYLLGFPDMIC